MSEDTAKIATLHNFPASFLSEVESFSRDLAYATQHLTDDAKRLIEAGFSLRIPLPSRFFRHVELQENGCWLWTGACTSGPTRYKYHRYSQIRISPRRRTSGHRFAYLYTFGNIPIDRELDHLCRNKLCVNPTHLELVTRKENLLRRAK